MERENTKPRLSGPVDVSFIIFHNIMKCLRSIGHMNSETLGVESFHQSKAWPANSGKISSSRQEGTDWAP